MHQTNKTACHYVDDNKLPFVLKNNAMYNIYMDQTRDCNDALQSSQTYCHLVLFAHQFYWLDFIL